MFLLMRDGDVINLDTVYFFYQHDDFIKFDMGGTQNFITKYYSSELTAVEAHRSILDNMQLPHNLITDNLHNAFTEVLKENE